MSPGTSLLAVGYGLVPYLTPECMVREAFDVLTAPLGIECFQRLHNLGMQGSTSFLEQTGVGYLLGQGMLEGVYLVREEPRLIKQLCTLEVPQAPLQRVL